MICLECKCEMDKYTKESKLELERIIYKCPICDSFGLEDYLAEQIIRREWLRKKIWLKRLKNIFVNKVKNKCLK